MAKGQKQNVLHRSYTDGRCNHERTERRMVYRRKDGSLFIRTFMGNKPVIEESGVLVVRWDAKSIPIVKSDIFNLIIKT